MPELTLGGKETQIPIRDLKALQKALGLSAVELMRLLKMEARNS